MGKRMYFSFDTKEMPGAIMCRYVEFGTEIVREEKFKDQKFQLVDVSDPRVAEFLKLHDKSKK